MRSCCILYPNQLFKKALLPDAEFFLIEEHLFFKQYPFHKAKLCFHRASMKKHQTYLLENGFELNYMECADERSDSRTLIVELSEQGFERLYVFDPVDDWLTKKIEKAVSQTQMELVILSNPSFLNKPEDLKKFFGKRKEFYFQTSFYKEQRKNRNILVEDGQPAGGKWSFDHDNRKKFPKNAKAPTINFIEIDEYWQEAVNYVTEHFGENPGICVELVYPTDHRQAQKWFKDFIEQRFDQFGDYEDAMVKKENVLHHSLLSPLLNVGLLLPEEALSTVLKQEGKVSMNSLEGFVRQLIGWREFIRGMYQFHGVKMRTKNFWGYDRKLPDSFYTANTGVEPVDNVIRKVLATGYCHHIERLMVLGNFMLLCEIDPDDVYQWFMELFIDSYDWVMVPNVYGMSQFSDGGLFATKPYISGSNYIRKMSDYEKGAWCEIWDALFWRFIYVNRSFFESNHRMSMMVRSMDRMDKNKLNTHLQKAERYLASL